MGDFVDAKTIDMNQRESESSFSDYKENMKKYVNVKSHTKTLEFSGEHYFGLTTNGYGAKDAQGSNRSSGFEARRNYVQVKGYFNDHDYFRVTMDATKELETANVLSVSTNANAAVTTDGPASVIVKYAYLYLDKVLPFTGVEIGIAHRPWIDYEEHNAWNYRSINKVILEDKFSTGPSSKSVGVDTMNSADLGVNFQTKTPYFSSELGLFNGEGYHSSTNQSGNSGLSAEWRMTGHIMGNGEQVGKYKLDKDTYANISFGGLSSQNNKMSEATTVNAATRYNRNMMLLHAVYNQPEFLIAAQVDITKDQSAGSPTTDTQRHTWSVNGEYRPVADWTVLARYDSLNTTYTQNSTNNDKHVGDANQWIYGVAYDYSKNVRFIASGKTVNAKDTTAVVANVYQDATTVGNLLDKQSWMLTTEVKW
jgi:hypothetical protein